MLWLAVAAAAAVVLMRCQASQPASPSEREAGRQTDRLGALLLDNRCREPHHCAYVVFANVGVRLSECSLPRALVLKVEILEAGERAREAGVRGYVLNADCANMDALAFSFITGWHAGRAVGHIRALFISWLQEHACLCVCNQQKGKGVVGLDH